MSETSDKPVEYVPVNWQNRDRPLTEEELNEINSRVSGVHFAKEQFASDPIAMQMLYAAEALLREVQLLRADQAAPSE